MPMRHLRIAAVAMLLSAFCGGCFGYMQDDGEFTLTFGTSLGAKHTGPKDVERESRMGIDLPEWMQKPFVQWFIDSDGDGEADMSGGEPAVGDDDG